MGEVASVDDERSRGRGRPGGLEDLAGACPGDRSIRRTLMKRPDRCQSESAGECSSFRSGFRRAALAGRRMMREQGPRIVSEGPSTILEGPTSPVSAIIRPRTLPPLDRPPRPFPPAPQRRAPGSPDRRGPPLHRPAPRERPVRLALLVEGPAGPPGRPAALPGRPGRREPRSSPGAGSTYEARPDAAAWAAGQPSMAPTWCRRSNSSPRSSPTGPTTRRGRLRPIRPGPTEPCHRPRSRFR